jgi:ATP:corrinoid adenosyltransferase
MIPAVIASDTRSPGERELFARFRDDPVTADWTVLHSFNLPRHVTQVRGEADFVILAPGLGMLCLEVKAHRRAERTQEGLWLLGADRPTSRSPFKQAEDNMYSLINVLRERRKPLADALVAWSAVAFTHAPFRQPAVEWNSWEVIDRNDLRRRSIGALVIGVLTEARKCLPAKAVPGAPTARECEVAAAALRPKFEVIQGPAERREDAMQELRVFSEEQYGALDGLTRNPRVVFEGPAGTGKTLLALEAARRAAAEGLEVGLICFNRLLGRWIATEAAGIARIHSGTLHELMYSSSGARHFVDQSPEFFQSALPDLATIAVLESNLPARFDVLIVDEAQDILRDSYLDFLDVMLKGGIASGRWIMFGDFERQALFDAADVTLESFNAQRGPVPVFSLRRNCRNTPRVARWTSMLSHLEPPYTGVRRPDGGPSPRLRYFTDLGDQVSQLVALLEDLYRQGFEGRDVVLLSPIRAGVAERLPSPWRDRLKPYGENEPSNYVRHSTIQAFKGLEAAVVVVTDVTEVQGEYARSLFYTATTRATQQLHVLADAVLRDEFLDVMDRFDGGGANA